MADSNYTLRYVHPSTHTSHPYPAEQQPGQPLAAIYCSCNMLTCRTFWHEAEEHCRQLQEDKAGTYVLHVSVWQSCPHISMCADAGLEACLKKVQGFLACGSDDQVYTLLLVLCWLSCCGQNACCGHNAYCVESSLQNSTQTSMHCTTVEALYVHL